MSNPKEVENKETSKGSSTSTDENADSRAASVREDRVADEPKHENEVHRDPEKDLNPLSTAVTTESVIPQAPDGGLHAWLKVFGGFFIYVNIWFAPPPNPPSTITYFNTGASH
jgi:hypothetical protein